MNRYSKLVRDKIPEIILANGEKPKTKILSKEKYKLALLNKVVEEAKEVAGTKGKRNDLIKEVGDLEEVLMALMDAYNISCKEIGVVRRKRKKERGGFSKRIFLESTT